MGTALHFSSEKGQDKHKSRILNSDSNHPGVMLSFPAFLRLGRKVARETQ